MAMKRPLRRALLVGCLLTASLVGFGSSAPAAGAKQRWLYIEFNGSGTGHSDNATGNGGSTDMNASWTFLYKLPVQTFRKQLFIPCQNSSCDGHAFPYAATGSGHGSISGSGNPNANCSTQISASTKYLAPATALTWTLSKKKVRIKTIAPMEAGLTLADPTGHCPVFGGVFAEGSGTADSGPLEQALLVGHTGVVHSRAVAGHSSLPAGGGIDTPQTVSWSGFLKFKLGGCTPTLKNLKHCFPLPKHR